MCKCGGQCVYRDNLYSKYNECTACGRVLIFWKYEGNAMEKRTNEDKIMAKFEYVEKFMPDKIPMPIEALRAMSINSGFNTNKFNLAIGDLCAKGILAVNNGVVSRA